MQRGFHSGMCEQGKLASGLAMSVQGYKSSTRLHIYGLHSDFPCQFLLSVPSALLGAVQHVELNLGVIL